MAQQPPQLSEEEYYYKADNLIRSSCLALQSVFRQKWVLCIGSEWSNLSATPFITGIGKKVYQTAFSDQKKLLRKGCLEEWDISILSKVLLLLKSEKSDLVSKEETSAIHCLARLRNKVAHNALKKVSGDEYQKFEKDFRESLTSFGIAEAQIEKLVKHAGITSAVSALEQANNFQSKGDEEHAHERYKEAIEFFDEALTVPSLLPLNLGRIYEKRAASYLAMAKNPNAIISLYLEQADTDIKMALELNENSWKAHHIQAFVLKEKHEFEKAIHHFNRALAISPGQTEVREALDACKVLAGIVDREEHLDPRKMPMNLSERVQHFTDETGTPMTEEMFLKINSFSGKLIKGQDHVSKGHQYRMGWNVRQDTIEAARYYSKAAQVGNAEGIYNLAILHKEGMGVKQDVPYALELLRTAASMPPVRQLRGMRYQDVGVHSAQTSLGLMYEGGIGVPQSNSEAANWYKRAADNGCGNGANNVAIMYSNGRGVERDEKLAEKYWKLAVERKNSNAAMALYDYYVRHMEPGKARLMFQTAIELGDPRTRVIMTEVNEILRGLEQARKPTESPLLEFEKKNNLSSRGLTFRERQERMMTMSNPDMKSVMEVMGDLKIGGTPSNPNAKWAGMATNIDTTEILQQSAYGSETATNIIKTLIGADRFIELWGAGPPFSDSHFETIVDTLYECYCLESHLFRLPPETLADLVSFLERALLSNGSKASELDKKVRLSYAMVTGASANNAEYRIEVAKEGMRRYPGEVHFYQALSSLYGNSDKHKEGLKFAEKGLQRFPGNVGLLYSKAVHLRLSEQGTPEQKRESYAEFIQTAPRDHRKLPEAHYCVALTYCDTGFIMQNLNSHPGKRVLLEKVMHHYELGQAAEKGQLSCYLPYSSSSKRLLEVMIKAVNAETSKSNLTQTPPDESKHSVNSSTLLQSTPSEQKLYLQDPRRIETIKRHRNNLNSFSKGMSMLKGMKNPVVTKSTAKPKFNSKLPKMLSELRAITLEEMSPIKDEVYENRILNLTIIDEPILGCYPSVHLIAEDENGEASRLYVYNVPQDKDTPKTLGFGCRLSIINPYMRIAQDLTCGIRVDDPKCIIYLDGVANMCRYCGEENAPHKCAKCKFAQYCSRPCQVSDWKILNHKLICCVQKHS